MSFLSRRTSTCPNAVLLLLLDKSFTSKPSALALAINETEVSSVEETDEDDEATLYILSEMFSMLCVWGDIG